MKKFNLRTFKDNMEVVTLLTGAAVGVGGVGMVAFANIQAIEKGLVCEGTFGCTIAYTNQVINHGEAPLTAIGLGVLVVGFLVNLAISYKAGTVLKEFEKESQLAKVETVPTKTLRRSRFVK